MKKTRIFRKEILEWIQLLSEKLSFLNLLFMPDNHYNKLFRISRTCRGYTELQRILAYSGGSTAAATSKIKLVVTIFTSGRQSWTISTESSI